MVDRQKNIKSYFHPGPLSDSHMSVSYLQHTTSRVLTGAESGSSFVKEGSCVVVINHYTTVHHGL